MAEPIRFSLLVVLTIALLSVAFRLDDHQSGHSNATARPRATATAPAPTHVLPTSTSRPGGTTSAGAGSSPTRPGGTTPAGAAGGSAGSGTVVSAQRPILPVTGWPVTAKLLAGGFVLIGLGIATMRLSTPRRRTQRG